MSGALIPYPSQQQQQQQCQLYCGGCGTLLVYPYGSKHVRCALCSFVTSAPAHLNCGGCRLVLMYPAGAHAVKCSSCQYITCLAPQTQTVIVENPMTIDESGQLVSSVAVGITTKHR